MRYKNAGNAVLQLTLALLESAKKGDTALPGVAAEILGAQFIMKGGEALIVSEGRKFNYRAMAAEALWNLQPTGDVDFLSRYLPKIKDFCDGAGVAAWAYGPSLNSKIMPALNLLDDDRNSRQVVVHTEAPRFASIKNSPPCLSTVQWLVRDGYLNQIVTMRSNDVFLGLPLDIFQFSLWHTLVASHLGLALGDYIHNAGSMHLYARDVEKAERFVRAQCSTFPLPSVGQSALEEAIDKDTLFFMGHVMNDPTSKYLRDDMNSQLPALKPYTSLLTADYSDMTWNALKYNGYGIGW